MHSKRHRRRNRHRLRQQLRRADERSTLLAEASRALAAVREFQANREFWVWDNKDGLGGDDGWM